MARMIRRDPFAREELVRQTLRQAGERAQECKECCSPARYVYHVETDNGRRARIPGVYCGVGCMRAYNGGY